MSQVVLGLLILLGPQTIYTLNKQFEAGISLFYRASLGSLRHALGSLVDQGHAEVDATVEQGRAKKYYRVTASGRAQFFDWLTSPITGSDVETAALARLYFLGLVDDAAQRRTVLAGIVERVETDTAQLAELDAHLDAVDVPAQFARVFRYQRATLAYGLAAHRLGAEFFAALRDAESVRGAGSPRGDETPSVTE